MKKEFLLVLVLVVFFAVFGCNSAVQKSPISSESPNEIAVGQIVASFKKTFKERKFEANLIHFAENARIMTGGGKPVILSKDEYTKRIFKMRQTSTKLSYKVISWGIPKIKIISPNKARAITVNEIREIKSGRKFPVKSDYRFTKINGKWLIEKYTYSW